MIEKGPGFHQILDPLDSTPEVQKAPGFNSTRASLPIPLEQATPSEQYSKDYQAGEPLNNYLSRSQGAWPEFRNLLAQTGIEALAGSVEAASYLGDWEQVASKLQGEEGEYTNWLAESMKSLKEEGKTNWAPVYTNEENKSFNPSSFEWWAANGGQGLGSTLSLLIPGMAVSKLGKLAGLGELGQAVSAGLASRYAESTMEANQVYQDAITQGATPENAGEAASKTWNTNWIFAIQDIAAFSQISKGTQALSKGVKGKGFLSWMGELGTQMATEGTEEAGQYVVSEEAKKTALNANIDYFGEGFNKRLNDYIHDDEFKTSTLMGAMGGGVFHTAGSVLDKVTDVEQGTALNTAKDKIRNLFSRGIQKEVANATGDTITSQKIDQITLGEQLANAINTGKLEQHKAFVEEESKKPDTAQEAKELYTNHLKTVEELTQEQAKLRNNPNIPEDLHKPILLKRLEIAQNNYLSKQAEQELQKEYTNLDQQGFNPILNPLKRSKTLADTYKVLGVLHPELAPIAAQYQQAYQEQLNLAKQTDPKVEAKLVTPSDDKLFELTKQSVSLNEQKPKLQAELNSLSTPEGIAAHRQKEANKKINAESQAVLSKPNVTKEELLQAEKNANDPELKTAIAKKYQELVDKDRQDNLDQLGDIHEPDQSTIPVDDISPEDAVEPQEVNPNDEDVNPYDNLTPDPLGEFTPDDIEQRKKFGLTVEETKEIISGIDVETRQPKAKESTAKEEEIQAVESIKGKTTVSTTSLDKNSKGNPVEYISRYTGRKAKANEIIAVDPVTGQLLKNTPRVTIGQQVTLKLEKDYEWDQRNKPTYNEDNYTIAIYLEGVQKPIDFLRSADNKYMSQAEKDHNKSLRKQIYDSPTQSIVTTIVDKNIGTPRLDETQKDITILEFDFALDTDGRWRMQRTSYNPILFNVDHLGNIKVPNTGSMNGIDQSTLDRVQHSVETYFTKSDLKKMAGQTGVFRTAPDTSFRAIALDYRLLNDQEKGWVKTSLSKLIKDKDFNTLSEVIYIPIQTGGIYNNIGDNNRAKVPDLFKKEKGKYVMDRKRFHIASSSFKTELLIPTTATKKNSEPVWISIEDKQLDNFLEGKDFTYKILTYEEGSVKTSDAKAIEPQKIRDIFDKMLDQQFKNLNADNINSERQYTDPVNGEVHPSFYDYLLKTQTVTTKLKGSKTLGVGEDSSYSFNQVSLYLDPNPSQTKITVDEEGLIHTIEDETKQEPAKEDKELTDEELRRLFEEDAHLKPYNIEGYTYSLMGEEELNWFKNNIGEEFLEVAKNVDRFLSTNGVEAFGQYYNSLVTLAQLAPEGTAYHEAGHFMLDPKNGLVTIKEKERILDEASKVYNIKRSYDKSNEPKLKAVDYKLKAVEILQSPKADEVFRKGDKNNWSIEKILSELNVPKEQQQLIISLNTRNREELIQNLIQQYTYVVEINIAKELPYVDEHAQYAKDQFDEEELKQMGWKEPEEQNTQHYSNLTIPGGTNYTENEIKTPDITPSIKGHAQFSTDNGVGWFRSDDRLQEDKDEVINSDYPKGFEDVGGTNRQSNGVTSKTRRILEVQSDLFQKGRDKENLIDGKKSPYIIDTFDNRVTIWDTVQNIPIKQFKTVQEAEKIKAELDKQFNKTNDNKQNSFLQLLNKDSNWVSFFIKSIIQDSANKGYEKVLFPTGDTASKVEGHETLEEFKAQKEARLAQIQQEIREIKNAPEGQGFTFEDVFGTTDSLEREKKQIKAELERVDREGFAALKPIYNFYETVVGNTLKKLYKDQIKRTKDEYGNEWYELTLNDEHKGVVKLKSPVEQEQTGDYMIEEKIMEDFERYQLSNGKTKPKVERAKGFFSRLLQMIKSLLGLRSPLEKLFAKFNQGLTLEQRDRILANKGLDTNDEVRLKRLPGFFSALQQKATVGAFASEVMRLANEAAQRNNIHVFDFLSKQENVNKVFSEVKNNFTKDFDRIVESGRQNIEKGRYASYLAMGIGTAIGDNSVYNGNYEDIQREGLNPIDGFKTTVLRELTNWGFRVRINTKTEERKQFDDETQENLEDQTDETSERVFGKDSVELDPTDSLSARMRSFLSTIPEGGVDRVFGTPKFINFKKVDASLKMKLADSITPLAKLEQLAQKDSVIDSVLKALESERVKGNTQLYTEFFMKYKLDTQIEKTAIEETVEQWIPFSERTQSEMDRGIDKRRVSKIKLIDTDRTSADKSLINRWREEAVAKRLIDTHSEVKLDLVKPIQDEFDKFKTRFFEAKDKRNNLPYKDVKDTFIQTLTKLGITIPEEVWVEQEKRKDTYNELQRWVFGDRSLDSMLSRLMDGKSPYSESSSGLLADIARKSAPYIGDLGRGAYRSDDGKQKFSINLPSYITEFFNQAKQDTAGLLDRFKNDPRYAKNAFLGVIRDNNHRTKIGVTFSSAIRQGDKDPKAFDDRTEIESILYRLTAYHNNAGNYALINVGTPADKGKQPMAILPKERKALDFLRTVLTNNIDYEVLRITSLREYTGLRESLQSKIDSQQELTPEEQRLNRHIQANPLPTDIKNLKDSARFKYIPALDSIPNLTASISKGDISAQQYLEARKQAAIVIDKFIENEYQSFLKFLDSNDIISTKQNKDGLLEFNENIRISEGVLTTLVKGKEVQSGSFEAFLKEFFYNDLGWRLEMSKVFQGDLALYSNQDDYYKRQYQLVTPGYKPQTRLSNKSTVTRLVYAKQFKRSTIDELLNIAQMIRPSVTKTQVEDAIKNGSIDPLFKSIILKYQDINKTDAQSLMSIHAHKSIAEAVGQWTKEHEQVYQFAWKDDVTVAKAISDKRKNNSITEEEATNIRIMAGKLLMQPFKPFLIRDVEVKLPNGQIMMIKEQVKDSVTVITPELANTSQGYRDLLAYMKEHKVDIASAEDTVKVGSYGVINLNDSDSSKWLVPAEWQKRVTNIEDIRFPQFISDEKKEEISGTQAHKLVVANIDDKANYTIDDKEKTGKWVKEQYNELWAEKIIESAKELRTKLGLSQDQLKLSTDPDKRNKQIYKLWELLKQELSEREINENYKDVIELEKKINGTVDFTIPISFPAFGPKFQSILTNLWKKNVLKQKSAGYSAINMADWGVNYSDELKFVTNSAGDIVEAEIGLPIEYVNDIGLEYGTHINRLNGAILMDKLNENQKKALQFILYRIPTSNKSSMIPVRVARITPKHLNNIVIIPGELTIQQGLDFDVDKSQLLKRVLTDGKIDKENTDTKIFDLYWGVLTNKAHIEEMITPLASPTLEAKQAEFKTKGILENVEATSPFSPQSDISAEIRNKDGKAEIGIASRYNTGHAVLQMIKDYVSVQASIGIEYNSNSFSSIGDKNAVDGSLISTNHGESQQAALDAAKNPLLAYFNVVKGTMAGFHTMIEFGIPLGIVVDFYMQPVVREWTKFYKHEEQSKDRATDKLFSRYTGIKAQYDLLQGSIKPLTPEALEKGLEDGLTDTEHSARVLYEFLNVLNIAEQLTNVNNVLSVDTFRDATSLESLQSFLEQLKNATDPSKAIYVDKRVFNLETTPTEGRRLAAFFKYGIQDAINYISQFYPSTSEVYQQVRDTYAEITKQSLTNKDLLKRINQFTDYFMLQGDSSLFSLLTKNHPLYNVDPKLDKSDYRLRWSFFDPNRSLYDLIQKMVRAKDKDTLKYPSLVNNEFIKGLISEESRTNQVQVFGVRNTDANQDKTDYINGWYALMQSNDIDIRTLAHDLVRYSIQTSGFNYSTRSFYDLIPVQYLIESGVASLWEQLSKAPQVEVESNLVNFIRHNFRSLNRFPTLYGKTVKGIFRSDNILDVKMKENRMEGFTLKSSFLKDEELPRFYRINDYNLGEYRLYESNPSNIREFREVAPLGGKNWVEVSPDRVESMHSEIRSQKVGTPDPWNTKQFNLEGSTGTGTNEFLKKYLPDGVEIPQLVLERLIANEVNIETKKGLEVLLRNVDKISTRIEEDPSISGKLGVFRVEKDSITGDIIDNVIKLNPNANIESDSDLRYIIHHELTHAYGVGVLQKPEGELQINYVRNINRVFEDAKKRSELKDEYGLTNIYEFHAELASNINFRKKLRGTDLWSRILRSIRKLLGLKDTYDKVLDQYYTVLDQAEELQKINPGEFALKIEEKKKAVKKQNPIEQMHSNLKARIKRLKGQGKNVTAEDLKLKFEKLQKMEEAQQMVEYILLVDDEMKSVKTLYKSLATTPDKINPNILQPLVEQLTSYKLLGSYNKQIARNPKQFEGIIHDKEVFDKNLSDLIRDVSRMTESVNKLALIRSAHIIKQTSSDPNLTIEKIEEELEVADRDITILSRLGDVGRELRDKTLSTLYTLISKVNSAAWRRTQEDLYSTETKKVETKIDILIPNSNNPNFHWEQRVLKYIKTGKFKALQEYEKWLGKVDTFADKFAPVIDQNSKSKNDNGIQFISPWSKRGQEIRSIAKGSKDYPLRQFYETFVLDYLASQNNIPYKGLRPGLRVPSIQKSIMETLMEKGVGNKLQSIGEQALNNFRRRYDEADYYAVDENGDRQEYIPTRYVSKQDGQNGRMNTDQVSLDIATTLTVFSNEMYSREGMEKIVSDLELMKHTVKNRQVLTNTKLLDTPGISSFLTAEREGNELESGEYEKKEGVESEAYKAFDAGMRQQVYGQLKKEEGAFKVGKNKFSVSKMTDALLKYSGFNILFGNIAIPLTNIIVGKVGTIREAVGGNIINMKNAIAGEKLFAKEGFTSIKDFGRREKVSKLGRVFTYFNPYDHANVRGLGTDSNYAKAIFDKIITTGGAVAEFEIGVSTMGAVMDKFKAQKDGKDVSFYEAIDMDKNGKVKLNNGYTYKGKKEVSEEDIDEIKDYTLRLYQNIYGVNNKIDKAQSNEYAIGRLVGFMRGWFMAGVNTKWRTRFYDERLKMDQEGHYLSTIIAFNNVFTGEDGFIPKMVDTLRILTWQSTNNPELLLHPTELEYSDERKQELINLRKANIRKTMFELYMIVGLYALLALGWDDDDNDSYVKYLAARVKRELSTFYSPSTAFDVLRSPTVMFNTIDGFSKIIYDANNSIAAMVLDEDQPVYQRGPGKDQNKLWFDVKKQLGVNSLTQFTDLETKTRLAREGRPR